MVLSIAFDLTSLCDIQHARSIQTMSPKPIHKINSAQSNSDLQSNYCMKIFSVYIITHLIFSDDVGRTKVIIVRTIILIILCSRDIRAYCADKSGNPNRVTANFNPSDGKSMWSRIGVRKMRARARWQPIRVTLYVYFCGCSRHVYKCWHQRPNDVILLLFRAMLLYT